MKITMILLPAKHNKKPNTMPNVPRKFERVLINDDGNSVGHAYTDLYSMLISQSPNGLSFISLSTILIGLFLIPGNLKVPD